MFKLNKNKSDRSRDKLDFKFSNFQAVQVPKGWDKLFVSLVSVKTGKTVAKSAKASVRNGTCHWPETFSESIHVSQENGDSKESGGTHCKFVVAMGSSRSGVLGEVNFNLGEHASSKAVSSVTLQLKKCNYDTSLQFKIQCLTPRAKSRKGKETEIHVEDGNFDHDDMETKSDASDDAFSQSLGSASSNHLEPSLSPSDSHRSFESTGASSGKDFLSPRKNLIGAVNDHIERQDSIGSQNGGPSYSFRSSVDNRSNHSPLHPRYPDLLSPNGHQKEPNSSVLSSPSSRAGSSKDLLEAAEVTIEELRAEARMCERNAKKLMVDVDSLKKELSDQSRNQDNLNMELSASHQECNGLKQEIEHLKSLLEQSTQKQSVAEDLKLQAMATDGAQLEMEEEIKFLKESNASLTEQMQKTQESNLELLTILQELEGIVETQKLEIQNLSSEKLKLDESLKLGLSNDVDSGDSNPEGISQIKLQLQHLQETHEELESFIEELEHTVLEKDNEIEAERKLRIESESKWEMKASAMEGEIMGLKAKLCEAMKAQGERGLEVQGASETDLAKEVKLLRTKIQELENDCDELTEENLQLILKLKGPGKDFSSDDLVDSLCGSPGCTCEPKVSRLRTQLLKLKQEVREKEALIEDSANSAQSQIQSLDLESKCSDLEIELQSFKEKTAHLEDEVQKFLARLEEQQTEVQELQRQLKHYQEREIENRDIPMLVPNDRDKVEHNPNDSNGYANGTDSEGLASDEIEALRKQLSNLENQISSRQEENWQLQESLEREKATSSECIEEQRQKIMMLERSSSEMEKDKEEVEKQLALLEKENVELTERISALEAQLRYLTDEKEACQVELQESKSQVTNLRDEVKRLEIDLEAQKAGMKQKMQDLQYKWLEAQEECEYLKQANPKLQATAENLIEECTSLQRYNGELKRQNMELVTRYSYMESQLRESTVRFTECSQKVEALESEFSVMVEEFSLKEKSLKSELDSLVNADKEYKEKLMQENVSLNNMYSQKVVEVEKIQTELAHLIDQISVVRNDDVTSDVMLELSSLRTEKAKLEVSLQQLQRQFVRTESKLGTSEAKIQELTRDLKSSRQKQEAIIADHDKVLKQLENFRSNEAKHKSTISGLEKNLKASGYERLQLAQEVSSLKEQLQRANLLQGEVLTLKTSLNNTKFECEKAKASLDLLQGEYEKLMVEKESLALKIAGMEKNLLDLEDCQRSRITLEEKVLRLEGDLAAREGLFVQDAELKFELNKLKRANGELQRKIKHLEQDQEEHLKRIKGLKKQLRKKKQAIKDGLNAVNVDSDLEESIATRDGSQHSRDPGAVNVDYSSKIRTLETELAEALEANEMYKSQIQRLISEQKNVGKAKRSGRSTEALEGELRDLRERYFQMSLKYAEVEAQREELVLKLKNTTNKRRWF